jgi:hypothetical protein
MFDPNVFALSKHVGALCVTRGTGVYKLGTKLGIDAMELLRMINGKGGDNQGGHRRVGEGVGQQPVLLYQAGC